jgi:hypothetical protein
MDSALDSLYANWELLQVVPYHSAILPQYTAKTIHSDHVNMTKFARVKHIDAHAIIYINYDFD